MSAIAAVIAAGRDSEHFTEPVIGARFARTRWLADAGNPHVRFDERGRETERSTRHRAPPRLDSWHPDADAGFVCVLRIAR